MGTFTQKSKATGRFLKRNLVRLITILQIMSAAMLGACSFSVYISPALWSWASIIGLTFPLVLLINVGIGLVALCVCRKRVWITVVGLIACVGSIRNYAPLNLPSTHPEGAWHVMTWNVGGVTGDSIASVELLDYLAEKDIDLLCLQEVSVNRMDRLTERLGDVMPYSSRQTMEKEYSGLCVLSRWPVVGSQLISQNALNMVYATQLLLAPNDTLYVINCHLQSTHIDHDTRDDYAAIMHNQDIQSSRRDTTARTLIHKLRSNSEVRALQTDAVADYLKSHEGSKIIVAGDFNDTPISYSRQKIVESGNLMDCFRDSGNGISRTFNRNAFYVRIDHILASKEHYTSYETRTETSHLSDHYPVSTYLMPKGSDTLH